MKDTYNAPNKEAGTEELGNLEKKWGGKYPYAILSWRNSWDEVVIKTLNLSFMGIEKNTHNWGCCEPICAYF